MSHAETCHLWPGRDEVRAATFSAPTWSGAADGSLAIVNSCVTRRGRCRQAVGSAEPVPCSGNARLRVRFSGLAAVVPVPREGNYWIIALDDDYRWAMVGTPDRRFLWILARGTSLEPEVYARLVGQARCLGFAVDRLITC